MNMIDEVREVADNARISLERKETEEIAEDFKETLNMFKKLDKIDTENVEPSFHPVQTDSSSRQDNEEESIKKSQVFKNTDNEEDGFFKGPSA